MNRQEFSQKTKDLLAGRAGYQCSHPECNIITIGPGDSSEEIASIGEAAHIYSASLNGPRGQGGLSDDDLKSAANGFWACKNHAKIIDTNSGRGFSAEQLKSWKLLHEEKIKRHQGRLSRNVAWINSINIKTSTLYEDESTIYFGKVTYIHGPKNSCGKSTLLKWIACLSSYEYLEGWLTQSRKIEFDIDFYAPYYNKISINISNQQMTSSFNGELCLFNPIPIVAHRISYSSSISQDLDDEQYLCAFFNIDKVKLRELVLRLGSSAYSCIERAIIKYSMPPAFHDEEEDGFIPTGNFLHVKLKQSPLDEFFMLRDLSSSQKFCVIFEIALEKIKAASQYMPCILLLDLEAEPQIQEINDRYIRFLMSSEANFQTVIASLEKWKFHALDSSTTYILDWEYNRKAKIIPSQPKP